MAKVQEPSVYAGSRAFFMARDIAVTLFFENRSFIDRVTAMLAPAGKRAAGGLINLRGEVVQMDTYEVLSLLFLSGSFLIALLTYIDRNKRK